VAYENKNFGDNNKNFGDNNRNNESLFSKRIKAGKRRTYFFDVRATRSNDYFITITESKKRFDDNGYDRHKMFLYKEDFNKFIVALNETVDFVKTDLMPDFDFDAYNHDQDEENMPSQVVSEVGETESVVYESAAAQEPIVSEVAVAIENDNSSSIDEWKM
jgi:hypothetical protein